MSDVQQVVEIAVGGKSATQFIDGEKRFNVLARLDKPYRNSKQMLNSILIDPPGPVGPIPLSLVTSVQEGSGASMINRESNARLNVIKANVRGRDLGSTVQEAQRKIQHLLQLPEGYHLQWGGQYEYQQESNQRLMWVVPLSLVLIFVVLWIAFGSVSNALLVLSAVPLAVIGGVVALYVTQTYFSISAGVGFIALFGVAVQNGVIKVSYINYLRRQHHLPVAEAVFQGAITRMRPVLMTATVAILGLLPAALSNGIGSQSQKPFAIVIIGGLVSSTFLTLLVLPTLYNVVERDPKPSRKQVQS
jgi:cobalt-zinc-cadmium resistance protein CzcA